MDQLVEHRFTCPYCWAPVTMLVDTHVDSQAYVEDCEVCCRPIEVRAESVDGELVSFVPEQME